MFGNVGEELIGQVRQGAMLNFVRREPGAHEVGGGRSRHREHASLNGRPLHLLVNLGHGGLVVMSRGFSIGTDQMSSCSGNLSTESLESARLPKKD